MSVLGPYSPTKNYDQTEPRSYWQRHGNACHCHDVVQWHVRDQCDHRSELHCEFSPYVTKGSALVAIKPLASELWP